MSIHLDNLPDEQIRTLQSVLTPKLTKFIPYPPTAKQTAALLMNSQREMLYGGAAGGGKSVYLLMAAMQYVDVPGYSAILFRKTVTDLTLPGALIPLAHEWLEPYVHTGEVRWKDKEKCYIFTESGATINFAYMENERDHFRYQGSHFQFIGFDEVTHIIPKSYTYMFSRLRRLKSSTIPIRMRATANPGGPYGDYYYQRFFVDNVDPSTGKAKRIFLAANLNDNPHLDTEAYRQALAELDPVTRAQLEEGNWMIRETGDLFDSSWIISIDQRDLPPNMRTVRFWDLAAIDPRYRRGRKKRVQEPDWTVGFKMGFYKGAYYILDIIKVQKSPGDVEEIVRNTAIADGRTCAIRMEQEGGASGLATIERYQKVVLQGFDFQGVSPGVSKIERARPVAAAAQGGLLYLSNRCRNTTELYTQLEAFPTGGIHDDIIDAMSGAFVYFNPIGGRVAPPTAQRAPVRQQTGSSSPIRQIERPMYGSYWRTNMSNR